MSLLQRGIIGWVWPLLAATMAVGGEAPRPAGARPVVGAWMSSMHTIWRKSYPDPFPVDVLLQKMDQAGVTDIFFFLQGKRGGPFQYPTTVKNAVADGAMGKRDWTEDILAEADKYGMRVWMAYTTPQGKYPGTEFAGFRHPELIKLYCGVIDEIARKYGRHQSLAGFLAHEVNATEQSDNHVGQRDQFAAFCRERFGEEFDAAKPYPPATDPDDRWWRRFYLFKNDSLNEFMRITAATAAKHALKTVFCLYAPESSGGGWRWGYDTPALEKICDHMWIYGATDATRPHRHLAGAWIDIALTYSGANYPRHTTFTFHGQPLSFFEYSAPLFVEELRKYYSGIAAWTKQYGDYYLGHKGYTPKIMALYAGADNMKKWLALMGSWQGGTSAASVAVATTSIPYLMRHPEDNGIEYNKNVMPVWQALAVHFPLGGVLWDSGFALDPHKLLQYRLVIIPREMGAGLSAAMIASLRAYLRLGGKLLVLATPVVESAPDLTGARDLTAEFCGAAIKSTPGVGGFVQAASASIPAPGKKFWASAIQDVEVKTGQTLVSDKFTGKPLLIQEGNCYFSAIGFAPEAADYFAGVINAIVKIPIKLEGSANLRLVETVIKNNRLCLTFFNTGQGKLKVDVKDLGLTGGRFQLKDLLTGKVLSAGDAAWFAAGIPLEIKQTNQPLVLGLGTREGLLAYQGVVPADEDFAGLDAPPPEENPQVPIMVPDAPGAKVGVYHRGLGAQSLIQALKARQGFNGFLLPRLDDSAIGACDVIVIPQSDVRMHVEQAAERLRRFVNQGGGLLLTHDAVGYGSAGDPLFPAIGQRGLKARFQFDDRHLVRIAASHPVTAGFQVGDAFIPGFLFDHYVIEQGAAGETLVSDEKDRPVLVVGGVGLGKVALNGMLPGWVGSKEQPGGAPGELSGKELELFLNTLAWLAPETRQ